MYLLYVGKYKTLNRMMEMEWYGRCLSLFCLKLTVLNWQESPSRVLARVLKTEKVEASQLRS